MSSTTADLPRGKPSSITERNDFIECYFINGYQNQEIQQFLRELNETQISIRQIKRILRCRGLRRRPPLTDAGIAEAAEAIEHELDHGCRNVGYRAMHRRLATDHRINISHDIVRQIIQYFDPDGVEGRRNHVLRRRTYSVKGPNHVWHIDGNDKLLPYGFAIHGGIDGFSRKIIWLHVSSTNKKPEVVAGYFIESLKRINGAPLMTRFDNGTENNLMADLHVLLTNGVGTPTFGRSTSNQRIEAWWNVLKRNTLHEFICLFRDMIDEGIYNTLDELHREAIRFFFGNIIANCLSKAARDWNNHRIRPVTNSESPPGKPNVLYHIPPPDAEECKVDVDTDVLEDVQSFIVIPPMMYDEKIVDLVEIVMGEVITPTSKEAAKDMYVDFLEKVEDLLG